MSKKISFKEFKKFVPREKSVRKEIFSVYLPRFGDYLTLKELLNGFKKIEKEHKNLGTLYVDVEHEYGYDNDVDTSNLIIYGYRLENDQEYNQRAKMIWEHHKTYCPYNCIHKI